MAMVCFHCGASIPVSATERVGRSESCPSCKWDMHVCLNCQFYDPSAYNQCRENQAERVLDKERSNCCDYFAPADKRQAKQGPKKNDVLGNLDKLFK